MFGGGGASGSLQKRALRWRGGGLTNRCRGGGLGGGRDRRSGGGGEGRLSAKAHVAVAEGGGGRDRRWGGGGLTDRWRGGGGARSGGRGRGGVTDHWRGGGGVIDGLGGVRLSEKARGATARPALKKRAARRRVRLSKKARSAVAGRGGGGG